MSGELLALFGVALAAAVAELMIPAEGEEGTRRLLHFLTALVVLVLILRPFFSSLSGAEGFLRGEIEWTAQEESKADYEAVFAEAVAARSAVQLQAGVQSMLGQEYGIAAENCKIGVEMDDAGELKRITVILSGAALLQDPEKIQTALAELFPGVTVEVR